MIFFGHYAELYLTREFHKQSTIMEGLDRKLSMRVKENQYNRKFMCYYFFYKRCLLFRSCKRKWVESYEAGEMCKHVHEHGDHHSHSTVSSDDGEAESKKVIQLIKEIEDQIHGFKTCLSLKKITDMNKQQDYDKIRSMKEKKKDKKLKKIVTKLGI